MFVNLLECIDKIEKLDALIRYENTGKPNELAAELNLSERHVYRLIGFMKNMGAEIIYCRYKQTYKYVNPVKFTFGFEKVV